VLEDLGGESNGSLDVEVPVLGSVDEITTDYDINTRSNIKIDGDLHFSKGLTFLEVRVILILWVFPACPADLSRSSLNSAILNDCW
jgi:hypothetical protein